MAKIKISMPISGKGGLIEIDGIQLTCARSLDFRMRPGEVPIVTLELIGDIEVEIDADLVTQTIHPKAGDDVTSITDTARKYAKSLRDAKEVTEQLANAWDQHIIRGEPKK